LNAVGLLDDAIREHLDLKRRRGADPAEVEKLEREALGPVRRNTGAAAVDEAEPELTAEQAYELEDEFVEADEAEAESAYQVGGDLEPAPPPPPADWGVDDDRTRVIPPAADDPFEDEPGPRPDAVRGAPPEESVPPRLDLVETEDEPFADERPAGGLSDETTEYDVREAFGTKDAGHAHDAPGDDEDEDEDMLEETPEFLQDTPDHDRLWFEQRSPRDFDFDG
jgi:hypothetical protein